MDRKLFFGVSAVDSILPVVNAVNKSLIKLADIKYSREFETYSPWMSIPNPLPQNPIDTSWFPNHRFVSANELLKIKKILASINPANEQVPSLENYPIIVSALNDVECDHFNSKIIEAEETLCQYIPSFKPLIDQLLLKYIPIESTITIDRDFGMSALWFKGAIFLEKNQMRDKFQRTENIAHEIAHQIIIHYQLNDTLIRGNLKKEIYSGIRQENRPAILSFHGAAALSYMLWVQKTFANQTRIKLIEPQLVSTLDDLRKLNFTPIGQKIFEEFHEPLYL